MAVITVAPERRTKLGLMPSLVNPAWSTGTPDREGWYAVVTEQPADSRYAALILEVSKLDGEDGWTVDAAFRGGFPIHANGFGARYLRTRRAAADIEALLDAAVPA